MSSDFGILPVVRPFCSFASVRQFRHADTWGCCQHGKEHVLLSMERQGFLWLPRYCLVFRPQRSCLSGMVSLSTASRTSNPRHASDRHRLVVVKPNSYLSNSSLAASVTLWSRFVSHGLSPSTSPLFHNHIPKREIDKQQGTGSSTGQPKTICNGFVCLNTSRTLLERFLLF